MRFDPKHLVRMRVKYRLPEGVSPIMRRREVGAGDFGVIVAGMEGLCWGCFHKYLALIWPIPREVLRAYETCHDEFLDDIDLLDAREWAAAQRLVEEDR